MTKLVTVLRARAADARAKGHEYVKLIKHWQRSPRNWDRARVIPGRPSLMGRVVGATGRWPGEYLVDVKLVELEAWLKAHDQGPNFEGLCGACGFQRSCPTCVRVEREEGK